MATHCGILAWRIPWTGAWQATVRGVTESWTQLSSVVCREHVSVSPWAWAVSGGTALGRGSGGVWGGLPTPSHQSPVSTEALLADMCLLY